MKRIKTRLCLCSILLMVITGRVFAVDMGMSLPLSEDWNAVQSKHGYQYTFQWENDAFLVGTISDRFYTNGVKGAFELVGDDLFYRHADGQLKPMECDDGGGRVLVNDCKQFSDTYSHADIVNNVFKASRGYYVSQGMFTPSDIEWTEDQIDLYERPYAGWLQVGFTTTQSNSLGYERFEWSLGCVGPCAMADVAQEVVHRNINDAMPLGWETQLKNSPTVQAKYEAGLQIMQMPWTTRHFVEPYFTVEAGNINIRSGVGARIQFPIGNSEETFKLTKQACEPNLQLDAYGIHSAFARSLQPKTISPDGGGNTVGTEADCPLQQYYVENGIRSRELLFYLDLSAQAVFYNGLLQGPIGYNNDEQYLTTGHKPFLTTLSGGFQVKWQRVAADFSYHTRSTESDGEALAFGEHSWLGLKVSTPDSTGWVGVPVSLSVLWGMSKVIGELSD